MNSPETLLIVDDDEVFTKVLARALKKQHFNVLVANSVDHANEISTEQTINKAIVDLKMGHRASRFLWRQLCPVQAEIFKMPSVFKFLFST